MPRIYLSPPDVGPLEREYLLRALESGWVAPAGPDVDAFEREIAAITGWPGSVALSSGTAALHLALLLCGVGPGDEVLVPTFTFAATVNAVRYCGANPVLIDSEPATWNMSPALLSEALHRASRLNRLPKAVVVVDLYGQCADFDEIVPQCRELGIPVIEDAAEAVGASYKDQPAGTLGDVGIYSFNGNKIITTSGGGMLLTPDEALAARARYLATQAREPTVHYEHAAVGFNYRLSNLLAAVGRAQLKRMAGMSARRLTINDYYRRILSDVPGVDFMPIAAWGGWNGWLTCLLFCNTHARDAAYTSLMKHDIESRPLWKPMHLQPVFRSFPALVDGTAERLFRRGLCLPSGSSMTDWDVERVAQAVKAGALVREDSGA